MLVSWMRPQLTSTESPAPLIIMPQEDSRSATADQIEFVNMIVDHLTENGAMDRAATGECGGRHKMRERTRGTQDKKAKGKTWPHSASVSWTARFLECRSPLQGKVDQPVTSERWKNKSIERPVEPRAEVPCCDRVDDPVARAHHVGFGDLQDLGVVLLFWITAI